MAGIRIDELDQTVLQSRDHVVPAMKDGVSVQLSVAQFLSCLLRGDLADRLFAEDATYDPGSSGPLASETVQAALDEIAQHYISSRAQTLTPLEQQQARGNIGLDSPWATQPVGVPIPLLDNLVGVAAPPTDKGYRYIKLTASDGYNSGVLTGQSVTGSAPLVVATAVIDLTDSPLDGQTVNLINTERRFLRAGAAGTVENDQMQVITGGAGGLPALSPNSSGAVELSSTYPAYLAGAAAGSYMSLAFNSASSPGARTGTETRPKNIGVTYFMRVL